MTRVAIPEWNALGLLPPMDPAAPTSAERSPYRVAVFDVVARFATSPERRRILRGWLDFRAALYGMGLTNGFQWLDGSFMEQVEALERRAPKDLDVVTFLVVPDNFEPSDEQAAALNHDAAKETFSIDSYFVEINRIELANLVRKAAYWYSVWSHRRNQTWKGYLQVDLDPDQDQQALDWLIQQDTAEVQP